MNGLFSASRNQRLSVPAVIFATVRRSRVSKVSPRSESYSPLSLKAVTEEYLRTERVCLRALECKKKKKKRPFKEREDERIPAIKPLNRRGRVKANSAADPQRAMTTRPALPFPSRLRRCVKIPKYLCACAGECL